MEHELDEIALEKLDNVKVLKEFYDKDGIGMTVIYTSSLLYFSF